MKTILTLAFLALALPARADEWCLSCTDGHPSVLPNPAETMAREQAEENEALANQYRLDLYMHGTPGWRDEDN